MINNFFSHLEILNDFIWGYVAFALIVVFGLYFTLKSRVFQIRKFIGIFLNFISLKKKIEHTQRGIHPLKTFYAAIGGCIGIGNVVGIATAVQIGGPGALFWTWVGGFLGMLLQYSEVYLGMIYRKKNAHGGYDGGPMYFLPKAYKCKWIAYVVAFLLCLYGMEIFMFNVMADSISLNWHLNKYLVVGVLLAAVLAVTYGGIRRVGSVCGKIIPLFIVLYLVMGAWVLFQHSADIPRIISLIFKGAFTEQAAIGGFAGSSVMLAISMGLSRGAYSGDIGVGYMSIIHAESSEQNPRKQASLSIMVIFIDTFIICTMSILLAIITDKWYTTKDVTLMVQEALGMYFPHMEIFMPFFLFLLGYTTIISYFAVGVKCARFISQKYGSWLYYIMACIALIVFAFVDPEQAFVVMSIAGASLLIINLIGIFILRKQIKFDAAS